MSQKSRYIRYLVLLLILLAVVVHESWVKYKIASWNQTLEVRIYAINGDTSAAAKKYIDRLELRHFKPIEKFINAEAWRYKIPIQAVEVSFAGELFKQPPQPPDGNSIWDNIVWSLKFRGWAWYWELTADSQTADINLFVNYFDASGRRALRHSVGLQGGMIGLINGFADKQYQGSNNVVIAHELMHTLGASDKYGADLQPIRPNGYADPYQLPLYPQQRAEIMGGRIPLSATESIIPESLSQVKVGVVTAAELHWPVD